jgi:phenylalanyl-tRNA synthetase beta chain
MYLSLAWIKDFVSLPKTMSPKELGLKLTMHTVEIDSIKSEAERFNNVVVGKVLQVEKHPNADRLKVTTVDVGKEKLNIVCGAANVEVGQLVVVSLIGAKLGSLEIKETEIRGISSYGMICAEDELGLGDNHDGIMVLDKKAKVGQLFSDYLKLDDTIIEVDNKSLSNRPDLWGVYGLAREISAFSNLKLKPYSDFINEKACQASGKLEKLDVKVEDKELCPRYMAVKLKGIKVAESPLWLQKRLSAIGSRSINNIVDITNYVMFELGQPLHAFDASIVKSIVVRKANKNERINTLDAKERFLNPEMLVIADKNKALAVAGIMGGENSGINSDTSEIIIEAANFDPVSVRKTSQVLGLRTDASMRFEKSLDPKNCELALKRCLTLIKKVLPKAELASEIVDIRAKEAEPIIISLDLDWLNNRLGIIIGKKELISILESLEFLVEDGDQHLRITVPSFRATKDINGPEDILEEIVRMYGYNNINPLMPSVQLAAPKINEPRLLERQIKNILALELACTETKNYSFVSSEQLNKLNIDSSNHIKLLNPISSQHTLLRKSLIPNLLNNIKLNQAKYSKLALFEIGSIFLDVPGEEKSGPNKGETLPYQEKKLAIVLSADKTDLLVWGKSLILALAKRLLFEPELKFESCNQELGFASKTETVSILCQDYDLGYIASLFQDVQNNLNIKRPVAVLEISLKTFFDLYLSIKSKKYQEPARYPAVTRDLSFVVPEKILYNDIKQEILGFSELIKSVELFDIYQGRNLGEAKKSLAFHLNYQLSDRTLVSEEVDQVEAKLISYLEKKFEAQIRN